MPEKKCPKCGEIVEAQDLDKPADFYYCDCGWELCDIEGWKDRMADLADMQYDRMKEEKYFGNEQD